ncbi:MAG TPA: CocE/NonD family hydrolase [Gammaproteobacteria bacterium]
MSRMLISLLLLGFAAASMPAGHAADAPAPQAMSLSMQQMIPLRDGVHLSAMIWKPAAMPKPLPVVLVMTPYIAQEGQTRAAKFTRAGYVYVTVDVRGRGDSEGVFRPLWGNGPDGADVVEWLAKQPWCDGRVTMHGGSYRGMVQWQVMAEHPKHLVAAIPTASVYPGHDFPGAHGIEFSYDAQWLAFTSGHTSNGDIFGDSRFWLSRWVDAYEARQPFSTLADEAGTNRGAFLEWVDHHGYDAYWAAYNPKPQDYAGIDIPILTITGYFDGDQPGAMRYYREFMRNASAHARSRHYLLMGPWDHPGTRYPQKKLGGLSFADNSVLDIDQLQIDWLDWVLKGGKRPAALSDQVNYYAWGEGADEWRHAPSLAALSSHSLKLYFSSPDGAADDPYHAGRLVPAPAADEPPDGFVSDPGKLQDAAALLAEQGDDYLTNPVDASGGNRTVYVSEPLQEAVTLAGYPQVDASISVDAPDVDIGAELQALLPDGKTVVLDSDQLRARFRKGMDREVPVTPGVVDNYVFDGFFYVVRRLPKGTRLRVVIFPLDSPYWEKNFNGGGRQGYETAADAKVAHVQLHLDAAHPSFLELPLAP